MNPKPSHTHALMKPPPEQAGRSGKTARQLESELEIINSVQAGLVAQLDIQGIYDLVGDKLRELFDAQVVMLGTYDVEQDIHHPHYLIEMGERIHLQPTRMGPAARYLLQWGKTLHLRTENAMDAYGMHTIDGTRDVKSAIWVPLVVSGKITGSISLQNIDREYAFSDADVQLLEMLANSMSLALESAHRFDELQQRNAELAIINSVQSGLASQLDIQAIYDLVGDRIADIFPDTHSVGIGYFDPDHKVRTWHYMIEKGQRYYPPPDHYQGKPYEALYDRTARSRVPVVYNENIQAIMQEHGIPLVEGTEEPKSVVFVPMIVGDKIIGQIDLQNMERELAFSESDIRLLSTLANSASIALDNARLFAQTQRLLEETRQRAVELTTINTVSQALVAEPELEAPINLIGEQLLTIFNADIVYVALHDRETDLIHFPFNYGEEYDTISYGEGLTSKILESGQPLLINENIDAQRTALGTRLVGKRARSYLGVPIVVSGQAIGVISVQSTQVEGRFSPDDVRLLSTIAANFGTAIRNASLFDEIKHQKTYNEMIIANSPAAIVVIDRGFTVTGWNPAAERLFGYSRQEAVGKNVDLLVANRPDLYEEAVRFSKQGVRDNQIHFFSRRTRKDGSLVEVEAMGLPVIEDGQFNGYVVIYHDITELQRARQEAIRANEAKSAFLANMSHELRTPLNAIIGFTRIVRRKGEGALPEMQLENLDKVLFSSEHLLGLINSVLDISKIEAGRMDVQLSSFEVEPLIEMVISTTQPLIRQDQVRLVSKVASDLPRICTDMEKVKQILYNLLSNAAKFTHQGQIEVAAAQSEGSLVIQVKDSGIGIPQADLEHVFEEFHQGDNSTTRQYGGTGLGLSISRHLALLLEGDLSVESEEGVGSTFTLTLPLLSSRIAGDAPPGSSRAVTRLPGSRSI